MISLFSNYSYYYSITYKKVLPESEIYLIVYRGIRKDMDMFNILFKKIC